MGQVIRGWDEGVAQVRKRASSLRNELAHEKLTGGGIQNQLSEPYPNRIFADVHRPARQADLLPGARSSRQKGLHLAALRQLPVRSLARLAAMRQRMTEMHADCGHGWSLTPLLLSPPRCRNVRTLPTARGASRAPSRRTLPSSSTSSSLVRLQPPLGIITEKSAREQPAVWHAAAPAGVSDSCSLLPSTAEIRK